MSKIDKFVAREILDSRGNPTIEVDCILQSGVVSRASVPSGASTGSKEAKEIRDGDKRFGGLGVLSAVSSVKKISDSLTGRSFSQKEFDNEIKLLDGSSDKSVLGANAMLGASVAFCKACAKEKSVELFEYIGEIYSNSDFKLPRLMLNIINGGKHADSGLDIQEFMIVPRTDGISESIEMSWNVIKNLRKIILDKGLAVSLGDEGGFAPKLHSNEDALNIVTDAIDSAGLLDKVEIALDVAASGLFREGKYNLTIDGKCVQIGSSDLISWYKKLVDNYPIISIEDGLEENDWIGFRQMVLELSDTKVVGDDLTVSHSEFIRKAGDEKAITSVIIKPNQIGTVSETIEAIKVAREKGIHVIVSHRSGETCDSFIADLSVGMSADAIKAGSLARGERVTKYNRLLEIESILKGKQM